jgi:hypothetical protein
MKEKVGLFRVFPELEADLTSLANQQIEVDKTRKLASKFERNPELWGMQIGPEGHALSESFIPQLKADQLKMAETHAMTRRSRREIDNSAVQAFIGDDANLAAAKVWASATPVAKAKEVMAQLKDPAAIRGFQRAMWDEMVRRFEGSAISAYDRPMLQASNMRKFLDRNKEAMKAIGYTQADINLMERATDANLILAEAGKPVVKGDSSTADKLVGIMRRWGPLISRMYAGPLGRGLVSMEWLIGEAAVRNLTTHFKFMREQQVRDLMMDAFMNPHVAHDLALAAMSKQEVVIKWRKKPGSSRIPGFRQRERIRVVAKRKPYMRFRAHLLRLGVPMAEDQPKQEEVAGPRVLSATEQALALTNPQGTPPGRELTLSGSR